MKLIDFEKYLDQYLEIDRFPMDPSWNGLQVDATPKTKVVRKIAFAVDAGITAFEKTIESDSDVLVVHHGIFWQRVSPAMVNYTKERIELLQDNNLSLYAAHLPLDRHPEVGNNAQIIKLLGGEIREEFIQTEGMNISWTGELTKEKSLTQVIKILERELKTTCQILNFGNKQIKTVAVCTGGSSSKDFYEAVEKCVDLYITGEPREIYHTAKDIGINVVFAGHYATETTGIRALQSHIQAKFGLETTFINSPTGI